MRQILVTIAVAAVAFWSGWQAQCSSNRNPEDGIQWQFSKAAARGDIAEMEHLLKQYVFSMVYLRAFWSWALVDEEEAGNGHEHRAGAEKAV